MDIFPILFTNFFFSSKEEERTSKQKFKRNLIEIKIPLKIAGKRIDKGSKKVLLFTLGKFKLNEIWVKDLIW